LARARAGWGLWNWRGGTEGRFDDSGVAENFCWARRVAVGEPAGKRLRELVIKHLPEVGPLRSLLSELEKELEGLVDRGFRLRTLSCGYRAAKQDRFV